MKQVGTFPTPYGLTVPVYEANDPRDPEAVTFTAEGVALVGGIYPPDRRRAFIQFCKETGRVDIDAVHRFGGGAPPRMALRQPKQPVYSELPKTMEMDIPIEAFVTLMMDRHRWCDRAVALMPAIDGNLIHAEGWAPGMPGVMGFAMTLLVTGALEHLNEAEIDCIEAAAVYALSAHSQWRDAGLAWLEPFRETWFRDWLAEHPAYGRWAAASIGQNSALPGWLAGGVQ
ncbi:hypothetical protein [Bosea beijingensis]